jgi:ADP-dependent NAD(P)H-hydrate dehydratase / NAD(P)H-hydrate epimerase
MKYLDNHCLADLKEISKDSYKGRNGRLAIIGGSRLFHGASLWALRVASRVVDMVYYFSVVENVALTQYLKQNIYSFIAVPFGKEADYLAQADAVLIGPGMVRGSKEFTGTDESGEETYQKTTSLLAQFPDKKWIIDAGALQVLTPADVVKAQNLIITPHQGEFEKFFGVSLKNMSLEEKAELVLQKAAQIKGVVVLKGEIDIIASQSKLVFNKTGNEGMTKGGTGDVLAGLVAALACTNDLFVASSCATYINGLAGDTLYQKYGPYFSADQLADQVLITLWQELQQFKKSQS